ncbi:MAG: hypothetical protein LBQ14_01290 [Treponema sp.]|jgi:hypothetical protein|nr:hypothetical protein [Treponema sp.]
MKKPAVTAAGLVLAILAFTGCSKKPVEPVLPSTQLPDLDITLQVSPEMEAVSPEVLKQMQAASADYDPISPFVDFPCYMFHNPATGTSLTISKLTFIDPETARLDPVSVIEEYQKNIKSYYGVDSLAVRELIKNDYKLVIMNFLFIPGGETIYLTKVLYYRYPQSYFMLDIYYDSEKTNPEELKNIETMLLSVQALGE